MICKLCGEEHNRRKSEFCSKSCGDKNYRINNKEKVAEYHRKDHIKNREKHKKYKAEHYQKNKEEISRKHKEYKIKNFDKVKELKRKYNEENRDELNKKAKEYYQRNKEWLREHINARKYAKNHNQRDTECIICGGSKELHFHHTNYKKNEGFTVCKKHHIELERGISYELEGEKNGNQTNVIKRGSV